MRYNPLSRYPIDLSVDEMAELVNSLSRANATGVVVNKIVSAQLEDRLRDVAAEWEKKSSVANMVAFPIISEADWKVR